MFFVTLLRSKERIACLMKHKHGGVVREFVLMNNVLLKGEAQSSM